MALPEPKTKQQLKDFWEKLERGAEDDFPNIDQSKLAEFRSSYNELARPSGKEVFKRMLLPYGPMWVLILTALGGVQWGALFWVLAIIWVFVINIPRYQKHKRRWSDLMQRGRESGIIA
ncbi:MAG: hypothetical protein FJ217_17125 [Ignavibacteria bacterium]|nr:hypothetical protein [Ignavibacteria bacterium]